MATSPDARCTPSAQYVPNAYSCAYLLCSHLLLISLLQDDNQYASCNRNSLRSLTTWTRGFGGMSGDSQVENLSSGAGWKCALESLDATEVLTQNFWVRQLGSEQCWRVWHISEHTLEIPSQKPRPHLQISSLSRNSQKLSPKSDKERLRLLLIWAYLLAENKSEQEDTNGKQRGVCVPLSALRTSK